MKLSGILRPVAALGASLALSACSQNGSNKAPPKDDTPIQLVSTASSIVIPISASLSDLQKRLNDQVPNPLAVVDRELDACIPAKYVSVCPVPKIRCRGLKCGRHGCAVSEVKTKISPDISCRLKGRIDRGSIQFAGDGQVISMSMPVGIDVSAKNIGGIIASETATGSADVRATAALDIQEDWTPTAAVSADYTWTDRIGVDIFGQRVTFASQVDPKIREAIAGFQNSIPAQLEAVALKKKLEDAWKGGFSTIPLSEDPPAWLRFTPQSMGYSGYQVSDGAIRLSLMAKGVTETFLGAKPSDPAPTPLPNLVKKLPEPGFRFYLPVLADYRSLEEAAKNSLRAGQEQVFDVPRIGKVKATIDDVKVYQTTGGAIAVGITLTADPPDQFFDTKGTIWLTAMPKVDNARRVAWVETFSIASETDNKAFDLLLSIVQLRPVNDALKAALRYDFAAKYKAALVKANAALNRELGDNLYLEGGITDVEVDRIVATPQGLFLGLAVAGKVSLRYGGT